MQPNKQSTQIFGEHNPAEKHFGRYLGAPFEFFHRPADKQGPWSKRRWQRKAWVFAGILTDEFILSLAIVDAGYIGNGFIYVYERKTGLFYEERKQLPFYFQDGFRPSLKNIWQLKIGNSYWLIDPCANNKLVFVYNGSKISTEFSIQLNENGLNTIAPAQENPYHFTYKNMSLPTQGHYIIKGKRHSFSSQNAVIDFSNGYPPRQTFWNWASLIGKTSDNQTIAINLVDGFNDGMENCLWLDRTPILLEKAQFHYNRPIDNYNTEILTDGTTKLQLHFFPEGSRCENINLFLLKSKFVQAFGEFSGKVFLADNKELSIHGIGIVEEHNALW